MNPITILSLITAIALSTSVAIIGGIFFVSNHAFAALCTTINKQVVCKTLADEVCTHYGANQVICTTRNFHNMISTT
jgi:hypothetical protein